MFPKLCTTSYRWVGDDLICNKCGQKIGFRYIDYSGFDYDRNTGQVVYKTKVLYFYPYIKYRYKIQGDN